jgi:hypothetical protein
VGVEPTTLAAGDRINGFEGHEGHRTPFASAVCKVIRVRTLLNVRNIDRRRLRLWCYWGAIGRLDPSHGIMQVGDREMGVPPGHRESPVPEKLGNIAQGHSALS